MLIPHDFTLTLLQTLMTHDDHYIRPEQKRVPLYLGLIQHSTYP